MTIKMTNFRIRDCKIGMIVGDNANFEADKFEFENNDVAYAQGDKVVAEALAKIVIDRQPEAERSRLIKAWEKLKEGGFDVTVGLTTAMIAAALNVSS